MANVTEASGLAPSLDPSAPSFRLEDWPLYWITRVSRSYAMSLDQALKRVGMDLARWRVLMVLDQFGAVGVSIIADHAVIKLSTMTKTIARMNADGLVSLTQDTGDRRVTLVHLTSKGRKATMAVRQQASRLFLSAFSGISQVDVQGMVQTLRQIHANLANEPYDR